MKRTAASAATPTDDDDNTDGGAHTNDVRDSPSPSPSSPQSSQRVADDHVVVSIRTLPNDVLSHVLLVALTDDAHVVVARVCRRWRALVNVDYARRNARRQHGWRALALRGAKMFDDVVQSSSSLVSSCPPSPTRRLDATTTTTTSTVTTWLALVSRVSPPIHAGWASDDDVRASPLCLSREQTGALAGGFVSAVAAAVHVGSARAVDRCDELASAIDERYLRPQWRAIWLEPFRCARAAVAAIRLNPQARMAPVEAIIVMTLDCAARRGDAAAARRAALRLAAQYMPVYGPDRGDTWIGNERQQRRQLLSRIDSAAHHLQDVRAVAFLSAASTAARSGHRNVVIDVMANEFGVFDNVGDYEPADDDCHGTGRPPTIDCRARRRLALCVECAARGGHGALVRELIAMASAMWQQRYAQRMH